MNKEIKKVLIYGASIWLLTIAGFGYNAYQQGIKLEETNNYLKFVANETVWKSHLMTSTEIQKINEYRAANPAPSGEKYASIFQGGIIYDSDHFPGGFTSEEYVVIGVNRAGFANEAEAIAAGFLERDIYGDFHVDWTKARNES